MKKIVSNKNLREFGIIIGIGFPLFFGCIFPLITNHPFRFWTLWVALPSLLFAYIKPNLLLYPYKLWIKFGDFLSKFNSKIVLALFFYIMITPVAILRKAIKFFIKKDSNKKSFYTKIGNEYLNSKFKDQF